MGKYILAHDLGTSGNKATIYDFEGRLCSSVLCEYPTFYPHNGWVEQNPKDWWNAVCNATKKLIIQANIKNSDIACVSFSAQMMGCLLVDKEGTPLRNMIIWADTRSGKQALQMEEKLGMHYIYRTTGHRISASYSAAKLLWIRENEPEVYQKAYKMLHAKDYIIHQLTGVFTTDYSDASGTNLFDINKKVWSKDILQALELEEELLPVPRPSTDIAGYVTFSAAAETGLQQGTAVVIGGGDGSCACVGAGVVEEGSTYNVLGSSSWISQASKSPIYDKDMRTFNWVHLDSELYTPCGTMQAAGYSYSWYKNTLCGLESKQAEQQNTSVYELINQEILTSPAGANGLLYLPYLLGERSPRWNLDARGAFIGLSVTTSKADISRSVLEGVGFNLKIILDIINNANKIDEVIMIGGGAKGQVWLQILADIWQKPLLVPQYLEEATSMGAAVCGGVGISVFENFKVIKKFNPINTRIEPNKDNIDVYKKLYPIFNSAYDGLLDTYKSLAKF